MDDYKGLVFIFSIFAIFIFSSFLYSFVNGDLGFVSEKKQNENIEGVLQYESDSGYIMRKFVTMDYLLSYLADNDIPPENIVDIICFDTRTFYLVLYE